MKNTIGIHQTGIALPHAFASSHRASVRKPGRRSYGRALAGLGLLCGLYAARPAAAQVQYAVTDLGAITGPNGDQANYYSAPSINDAGQIVVTGYGGGGEFSWNVSGLWQNGVFSPFNGFYPGSYSQALNGFGQIAGQINNAAIWQNGGAIDLGIPSGDVEGYGNGIDDAGELVGTASTTTPGYYPIHAFVYGNIDYFGDPYEMRDLGTLGGSSSAAYAINNNSEIIGWSYLPGDQVTHAFVDRLEFISAGGFGAYVYNMYDLDAGASDTTIANGINDNDTIVGTDYPGDGTSYASIYYWDSSSSSVVSKFFLWNPYTDYPANCSANAINNAGLAVGTFSSSLRQVAVLWGNPYTPYDLNTVISSNSGWTLYSASGINNSGQIVGSGFNAAAGRNGAFLLTPITLAWLAVSPTSVIGGAGVTGTVALTAPAVLDTTVYLSASSGTAGVPASVTVPAGQSGAQFAISTQAVTSATSVTITASNPGPTPVSAALTVTPIPVTLNGLSVSPQTVTGGASAVGTVALSANAPSGGATIALNSSNPGVVGVPTSVIVPAGAASATFTIGTSGVSTSQNVTIAASFSGVTRKVTITVKPAVLTSLSLSPASVRGSGNVTGTVTLNGAAPTGSVKVSLKSSSAAAGVPGSVTVATGATSAGFTVTTKRVSKSQTATITATAGAIARKATLTITH